MKTKVTRLQSFRLRADISKKTRSFEESAGTVNSAGFEHNRMRISYLANCVQKIT